MVCYRRCRGVRVTQLPQEVGIPVLPRGVRVSPAISLPTVAGAGLPRLTSPRLPRVGGARLAFSLLALTGALLALAITLLALAGARLPVAVPVRVAARAVRLGV